MKYTIFILVILSFSGCVMKHTKTNSQGVVIEEKYVVERPVKKFIKNLEFE